MAGAFLASCTALLVVAPQPAASAATDRSGSSRHHIDKKVQINLAEVAASGATGAALAPETATCSVTTQAVYFPGRTTPIYASANATCTEPRQMNSDGVEVGTPPNVTLKRGQSIDARTTFGGSSTQYGNFYEGAEPGEAYYVAFSINLRADPGLEWVSDPQYCTGAGTDTLSCNVKISFTIPLPA